MCPNPSLTLVQRVEDLLQGTWSLGTADEASGSLEIPHAAWASDPQPLESGRFQVRIVGQPRVFCELKLERRGRVVWCALKRCANPTLQGFSRVASKSL